MKRLDFAHAIRSKNAGRIMLTLDRLYGVAHGCRRVLKEPVRLRVSASARP